MKQQERVLNLGKNYNVELTANGKTQTHGWHGLDMALRYAGGLYDPGIHTRLRIVTADGKAILDTAPDVDYVVYCPKCREQWPADTADAIPCTCRLAERKWLLVCRKCLAPGVERWVSACGCAREAVS